MSIKKVNTAKQQKSKITSFHKLVPNMMTIAAMCAGMSAMQFAIASRWEAAILAIVIAAFIDAFDGAAARLLNASSKLGAELDSLSDFLCFGVAPAMVLHLWSLHDGGRWGWIVALAFAIAVALRLARFNAMTKEENGEEAKQGFFKGVPAPTGAGMAILPMIISFQIESSNSNDAMLSFLNILQSPIFVGAWMLLFAGLMVSRLPTFSTKQIHLPPKMVIPALAVFGLFVAGLINAPWPTLTLMGIGYGILIPISVFFAYKTEGKNHKERK